MQYFDQKTEELMDFVFESFRLVQEGSLLSVSRCRCKDNSAGKQQRHGSKGKPVHSYSEHPGFVVVYEKIYLFTLCAFDGIEFVQGTRGEQPWLQHDRRLPDTPIDLRFFVQKVSFAPFECLGDKRTNILTMFCRPFTALSTKRKEYFLAFVTAVFTYPDDEMRKRNLSYCLCPLVSFNAEECENRSQIHFFTQNENMKPRGGCNIPGSKRSSESSIQTRLFSDWPVPWKLCTICVLFSTLALTRRA